MIMGKRGRIFLGIFLVLAIGIFVAEYRARNVGPGEGGQAPAPGFAVPIEEIYNSGLSSTSIPSINEPKFVSVREADSYLYDEGEGIAFGDSGDERFYPFQLLVWHMAVNDAYADRPIAVTYDPLAGSALVYDRRVNGVALRFGVSGKLWNSNILLEDPAAPGFWLQSTGEAFSGEQLGAKLSALSSEIITWKNWKARYPNGRVLSKETGFVRDYTRNPYLDYEESRVVYFPLTNRDIRLHPKEFVFGYEGPSGEAKAYPREYLIEEGAITDTVGGRKLSLRYDTDTGALSVVGENAVGEGESVILRPMYWFLWAAIHKDSELYDPLGEKEKQEQGQKAE